MAAVEAIADVRRSVVSEEREAYEARAAFGKVPARLIFDPRISSATLRVYAALAVKAPKDAAFWVRQREIADLLGIQRQNVNRAIKTLVALGYVLQVHRKRVADGGDDSCLYRLVTQAPTALPVNQGGSPPQEEQKTRPPLRKKSAPTPLSVNQGGAGRVNHYDAPGEPKTPVPVNQGGSPITDLDNTDLIKQTTRKKREQAPAADAATARPPARVNPTWDALVEVMGYTPEARPERSRWGKVVKELNELRATPEEIQRRAARMIARWGRDHFSVNTIPNQWTEFAHDSGKGGRATNGASQQGYGTSARPAIGTVEEFAAEAAANRAQEQLVERALACGLTFDDLVGLSDEALARLCDEREREGALTHAD